jgi:hypothetical protein
MLSEFEDFLVDRILAGPKEGVNWSFLYRLSTAARCKIFQGFYGSDYYPLDLLDLMPQLAEHPWGGPDVNRSRRHAVNAWLYEATQDKFVVTDWSMIGFKSERDAALFKLFWL